MRTIRTLILEDDLKTLAVIMDELFNSILSHFAISFAKATEGQESYEGQAKIPVCRQAEMNGELD